MIYDSHVSAYKRYRPITNCIKETLCEWFTHKSLDASCQMQIPDRHDQDPLSTEMLSCFPTAKLVNYLRVKRVQLFSVGSIIQQSNSTNIASCLLESSSQTRFQALNGVYCVYYDDILQSFNRRRPQNFPLDKSKARKIFHLDVTCLYSTDCLLASWTDILFLLKTQLIFGLV